MAKVAGMVGVVAAYESNIFKGRTAHMSGCGCGKSMSILDLFPRQSILPEALKKGLIAKAKRAIWPILNSIFVNVTLKSVQMSSRILSKCGRRTISYELNGGAIDGLKDY